MHEITIGLKDDIYDELEDAAANAGVSVPEYAALLIMGGLNPPRQEKPLSWQAEDLLTALRRFGARPGTRLSIDTIFTLWVKLGGSRKSEDLQIAANEIGDRDFADVEANSVTLTEAGYKRMNS